MKVIIAGGRELRSWDVVRAAIEKCGFTVTEVVSGGAHGADAIGASIAALHGKPVKTFPAHWRQHGNAAGPIRNKQMAEYADALIACWDGSSPGTRNMIEQMRGLGKPVFVQMYSNCKDCGGVGGDSDAGDDGRTISFLCDSCGGHGQLPMDTTALRESVSKEKTE